MKKTRLTFIFALLATAGAWAQTFTVDNLKYTVADADAGTVELIGYKEQPTGKLVIPSTVTCDGTEWKSHATLTLLAKQDCPLWLQYDCPFWPK